MCYIFSVRSGMAIDDPIAFAPPPAFGPFRVLHQIGIGALGPVFRTYEPERDRLVAVKVFRLDITPEQAQVLADELARASDAGLFHPSIVEPIAAGVEGTVAYRAEEYVAAESLDAAIRHYAPAALDRALPLLTQLAGAIDFARTAGIGHGALHLRDIFVTPEDARASGFGVVEALERVGLRAPVRRPYSPPERIAGDEWSTPADVFSLAAITYELLTGRRPSGLGDQIGPLIGDHLLEFGAGMRVVLARAMDEAPARRYPTALAFASALEAAARGGRVSEAVMTVGAISGDAAPAAPSLTLGLAATAVHESSLGDEDDASGDDASDNPGPALAGLDEAAEPRYSDISDERDDDAAHYELARANDEPERTLFDDEAEADRGLASDSVAPASSSSRLWEDGPGPVHAAAAAVHARDTGRFDYAPDTGAGPYPIDEPVREPERPRPAVLPVAVTLILGLLIGFAAGYWTGGRDDGNAARVSTGAPASSGTSEPARDTAAAPPKTTGQAYSEQAVTQPSRTPPAIPGDGPPAAGTEPARPAPAATSGRLRVSSTPSRASVTVDGRWRGRTPLTLNRLKFGSYNLRVIAPGFAVSREEVTLSADEPTREVALRLERSAPAARQAAPARRGAAPARADASAPRSVVSGPFSGSIYVDSRPRGASVLIDGKPAGTTPARIPDISIGSHVVRLELADHRAWTVATRVAAGEETRVTGSLERVQ
jgi:eukaryotic-like serine/threonine-protein kinase